MRLREKKLTYRSKTSSKRSFYLLILLIVAAIYLFKTYQPGIYNSILENCQWLISIVFGKIPLEGFFKGIWTNLTSLYQSISNWSKYRYQSGLGISLWLFGRWLIPAFILGIILPTIALAFAFVFKLVKDYTKNNPLNEDFLIESFAYVKSKVEGAYRRHVCWNWFEASFIILMLGITLFLIQLALFTLWRWHRGITWACFGLFTGYAYWVYYEHFLVKRARKKSFIAKIDKGLELKEGLLTVLETKMFIRSQRLYKLVLTDVSNRIKAANINHILPHEFDFLNKRNLAMPLLIFASACIIASAYAGLASIKIFSVSKAPSGKFSMVKNEVQKLDNLLTDEALNLSLLSEQLLQEDNDNNEEKELQIAYLKENINNLAEELVYLTDDPGILNQLYEKMDNIKAGKTNSAPKPAFSNKKSWYDNPLKAAAKKKNYTSSQKLKSPQATNDMPTPFPKDWQQISPAEDITIKLPLQSNTNNYLAISEQLRKTVQKLLTISEQNGGIYSDQNGWAADGVLLATAAMPSLSVDNLDFNIKDPENMAANKAVNMKPKENEQAKKDEPINKDLSDQLAQNHIAQDKQPANLWEKLSDYFDKAPNLSLAQKKDELKVQNETDKKEQNKTKPLAKSNSKKAEQKTTKKPDIKPVVAQLERLSRDLELISLSDAKIERGAETPGKANLTKRVLNQAEKLNQIKLKSINLGNAAEKENIKTKGSANIQSPKKLEIDPQTKSKPLTNEPPENHNLHQMKEGMKVSARRIEALGNKLIHLNNPDGISFNRQKEAMISSFWRKAAVEVKNPKNINNPIPGVSKRVRKVENPENVQVITSELNELTQELLNWGFNRGNKASRLNPQLDKLTKKENQGKPEPVPLEAGGPDNAQRQAALIRGKRKKSLPNASDLERIRLEDAPQHQPDHDIKANVSAKLSQIAKKMENVEVASIRANMRGMNLKDFVVEKQRRLELENERLLKAKDINTIDEVTNKISNLSAQLGKFSLDAAATAKALADLKANRTTPRFMRDTKQKEAIDKLRQNGNELLQLSKQIKQTKERQLKNKLSLKILQQAKGLGKADINKIILNDYNKNQLTAQFKRLNQQLDKISEHTNNLEDFKNNSYSVSALGDRMASLGVGDIDFTAPLNNTSNPNNMLNIKQAGLELKNISDNMDKLIQQYVLPKTQNQAKQEYLQGMQQQALQNAASDSAQKMLKLQKQLESNPDKWDNQAVGKQLLRLSQQLKKDIGEYNSDAARAVGETALANAGKQIKQVAGALQKDPKAYNDFARRLEKISDKLKERNQEFSSHNLAANKDLSKLSSQLERLAKKVRKTGAQVRLWEKLQKQNIANETRKKAAVQAAQIERKTLQQAARDLFNNAERLRDLSETGEELQLNASVNNKALRQYQEQFNKIMGDIGKGKQADITGSSLAKDKLLELSAKIKNRKLEFTGYNKMDERIKKYNKDLNKTAADMTKLAKKLARQKNTGSNNGALADKLAAKSKKTNQQLSQISAQAQQLAQAARTLKTDDNKKIASSLKRVSDKINQLAPKGMAKISSEIDKLKNDLMEMDIASNGAVSYRNWQKTRENKNSKETILQDKHLKKELALANIEQTIRRLKVKYNKNKSPNNPNLSAKGLNIADKGISKAQKGIMDKLIDSIYNRGNFTATNTRKEIDTTPRAKMLNNAYAMEKDLSNDDVFKRIIDRLENEKKRIQEFEPRADEPSLAKVKRTQTGREGDFPQPDNIDHKARMLAMSKNKPALKKRIKSKKSAMMNESVSYHDKEKENSPYTHEYFAAASKFSPEQISKLPEDIKPEAKRKDNLQLSYKQALDRSAAHQLIPVKYQEIIREIYLD